MTLIRFFLDMFYNFWIKIYKDQKLIFKFINFFVVKIVLFFKLWIKSVFLIIWNMRFKLDF